MMITFTPPPSPAPLVMEYVQPRYGATPIRVESHGYTYAVTGNTLLSPKVISQVLAKSATPKDGLANLLKAYQNTGYTLVAVTGRVNGQSVAVSVYQGILTEVQTPKRIAPFFSGLEGRENVKKSDMMLDQILASGYAERSGHQLHVSLAPAPNPGGSVLTVEQTPQADYFPISGAVTFGNYGSRYSSDYIAGASASANLTHGVQITGSFQQGLPSLKRSSFGSNYYEGNIGASIITPYGIYGATASWTHYHLGELTYPLNPDGNIFSYQVNGTQLLYADDATRVSVNEAFNRVSYKETGYYGYYTLLDQQYNYLSAGGNINHALTVGGRSGNVNVAVTLNQGISSVSGSFADGVPGVPTSHFRYANTALSYQQGLPYGMQAIFTGQGQLSADTLPQQQQWVLGGLGNLSAWEPSAAIGDSGYTTRLEIDAPPLRRFKSSAVFGAFIETGGATYRTPAAGTAPWQTLSDVGLSLKLQLPYQFSGTAMAAVPISRSGYSGTNFAELSRNRINCFFVVQKGF